MSVTFSVLLYHKLYDFSMIGGERGGGGRIKESEKKGEGAEGANSDRKLCWE